MKTSMKNIIIRTIVLGTLSLCTLSCNMDYYPSDEQSSDILVEQSSSTIMDGCYSLLKDQIEYLGWPSGNSYCRHWFQMAEFPSDNICLSGKSTDPLFQATTYTMTDNLQNVGTLWMVGYKIIYMTNALIETLDETKEADQQTLGEAYFMRALMHLNLVTLFAKPYHESERSNIGIPVRTATLSTETKRDPVGDVYDQIVEDLQKASELMNTPRGNAGYPSKEAALGLLSRVYLYMENYDECINTVENMLGGAEPIAKLDANLASYFANAKTSHETLFCISHEVTDDRGQSSIGSMYNGDGGGWGEIYPSFPLLNLYARYPTDIRYTEFIKPQFKNNAAPSKSLKVYMPNGTPGSEERRDILSSPVSFNDTTGQYSFVENGVRYHIENRTIQGEYNEYHVDYNGEDLTVMLLPGNISTRNTYPKIYVTKFGYQNGSPTLSSPVVLRWAEVLLNAAEAYARTGDDDKALKIVNAIRQRAGIPEEGMFDANNMHGYANAIDVVMDERRLELAFEGHRMFDVYRNKQNMDRHYPGLQAWKTVLYTDPHTQYPIPYAEWTVSHIERNPGY